jgi:hypothetical protein
MVRTAHITEFGMSIRGACERTIDGGQNINLSRVSNIKQTALTGGFYDV